MKIDPVTPAILSRCVIAVPPLARNADLSLNRDENARLVRHLEAGGVTTLLYGGNANLYHVALSEYADLLTMLAALAEPDTTCIPSVGPSFGMMMDQADILRSFSFPAAMILPTRDAITASGLATAVRRFVDRAGCPAVLYVKHEDFVDSESVRRLDADGCLSWIKYAVVRRTPSADAFLEQLIDAVGPARIVSGMGEQPAVCHMRDFRLGGFTSGCVCIAPRRSMELLQAVQARRFAQAERIRVQFQPLETLRDRIHPVRVLHHAVRLAGIADTGPLLPMLSTLEPQDLAAIRAALRPLLDEHAAPADGGRTPAT